MELHLAFCLTEGAEVDDLTTFQDAPAYLLEEEAKSLTDQSADHASPVPREHDDGGASAAEPEPVSDDDSDPSSPSRLDQPIASPQLALEIVTLSGADINRHANYPVSPDPASLEPSLSLVSSWPSGFSRISVVIKVVVLAM
ncbi:hypothetical protein ETB97_011409 [Aspergillus alliaceus]|uniref:Uncharacterized protein n=1 Tax=Petromyces alliaceus TaxID=209559 RepID=A0A8H6AG83_PETAA|nr:hypothetical protein ETB97_011409 [Aspergillus burnettii]